MGLEFELKYAITPSVLRAIEAHYGDFASISMETTYYDTADHALSTKNMTMRRRFENGASVCTLKTPADHYGRVEWELEENWAEAVVQSLFEKAAVAPIPFDALKPVCGARFTRLAKTIVFPDCTLELALDEGILFGGGRELPLCELEVELKSGSQTALCLWAQALAHKYGLTAEHASKFKRALALAKGE